jgi:ABC-type transporter Mla MlaB component
LAAPHEPPPPAFVHALRPARDATSILLVVGGRIERGDAQRLSDLVRDLLEGCGARLVICDVAMLQEPDAAAVDLLCRFRLVTRRLGMELQVRAPSMELGELLFLMGLSDVVPSPPSGVQLEGQSEEREHARGVQEERDPADPSA